MSKQPLLVEAYMQDRVNTVHHDATVREVVALMIERKTNGLVVVDDNDYVVGILSSWDIVKHITPDYLEEDIRLASFAAEEQFKDRLAVIASDPIDKFMTKKVHCITKERPLIEAAALLTEFHIRQLPVVDDNNHLVGYLNRTDIKLAAGDVLTALDHEGGLHSSHDNNSV